MTNGSAGTTDSFGMTAYTGGTSVYHQAFIPTSGALTQSGTGSATNQAVLSGGNLSVKPK